jgi:hypothetical protein
MFTSDFAYLSVGDVARRLGVKPYQVTRLFYDGLLREDLCPLIAGRRLVPEAYLPAVAAELRRKGLLTKEEE